MKVSEKRRRQLFFVIGLVAVLTFVVLVKRFCPCGGES